MLNCTGSYTIIQSDINAGQVNNTSTADSNETLPISDSATVLAIQSPELAFTKQATQTSYDEVGDVISYTLVATNTGNIILNDVTISDPKLGPLVCTSTQPALLLPNATLSCTGSYTITQTDLDSGQTDNTAFANGNEIEPVQDSATVFGIQAPALTVNKTGTTGLVTIGDTILYTITTSNTGNVTLIDVTVTDAMLNMSQNQGVLAIGESTVVTGGYVLTVADLPGPLVNTASVTGTTINHVTLSPVTDTHIIVIVGATSADETAQPKGTLFMYLPTVQDENTQKIFRSRR